MTPRIHASAILPSEEGSGYQSRIDSRSHAGAALTSSALLVNTVPWPFGTIKSYLYGGSKTLRLAASAQQIFQQFFPENPGKVGPNTM
jgi:hypothetical protein